MATHKGSTSEPRVLLRYRYRDGTLQAALPKMIVSVRAVVEGIRAI